jgi:hypothetical protein
MAVSKQEVILEFNADTSDVTQSLGQVEQGIEGTSKATAGLTTQLDKMTGGAVTGLKNFSSGLKSGVAGLKSFKVALAATGIGLLLVAIGSLVSYFQNTKRGAEQLKVATAALGAAFDVIKDRVSALGGALVKFFTGDFKGALEDVQDAFTGITDEIIREAGAARDLQDAMNSLKDAERGFIRQRAETNRAIAETRLRVEDETLSYQERIAALEEAIALEEQTVAAELALAEERARIIRERIELGESLEEDLDRQAEAEARVIELQTASLRTQKRLEGERQSLLLQRQAQIEATIAAERKAAEEELKLLEKTRKALLEQRPEAELIQQQEIERGLVQNHQSILTGIVVDAEQQRRNARRDSLELAKETLLSEGDAIVDTFGGALNALSALQDAFSTENEHKARRNFKIQKALSLAQTTLGAVQGVQNAFTTGQKSPITALFPGYPFVQAGIAAAFGAAQIATVGKSKYQGGSTKPSVPSGGGGGGGGASAAASGGAQAPQLDLGFLGAGAGQEAPVQAYVLAENVSTAQQANQKIQDQATL